MIRRAAALAALLIATAVPSAMAAERLPLEFQAVDTTTYPEIAVIVSAPRELAGVTLANDAFVLTEGGSPRSLDVTRLPDDDLEVVLSIDTSGSMKGIPLEAAKAGAEAFVRLLPAKARVAIVGFSAAPYVVHAMSTDRAGQIDAIRGLVARGETALYDGIVLAVAQFPSVASEARRALVLLSDGGDTASDASLASAIASMRDRNLALSAVELVTPESDHRALASMADTTGGRILAAEDPAAIVSLYDTIAADLLNQYRLVFDAERTGRAEVRVVLTSGDVTAEGSRSIEYPAAAPSVSSPEPASRGLLETGGGLLIGAAATFLALLIAILLVLNPGEAFIRFSRFGVLRSDQQRSSASGLSERATAIASRALASGNRQATLSAALERAGMAIGAPEFVVRVALFAGIGLFFGLLLGQLLLGLLLAAAAVGTAALVVSRRTSKRREQFADQLGDTLQLMAGSLRVGHGLMQAVDAVAREADSPTADEFRRLTSEVRLGRDLGEALEAVGERVASEDFEWVVQAILIHREVGGDLAEVLDRVAETIRDRNKLRRQVKALSAEGRISAVILILLPFGVAAAIAALNRDYFEELLHGGGLVLLTIGGVLMAAGALWLRRIVRPEF
jgi:tight adherence protein B